MTSAVDSTQDPTSSSSSENPSLNQHNHNPSNNPSSKHNESIAICNNTNTKPKTVSKSNNIPKTSPSNNIPLNSLDDEHDNVRNNSSSSSPSSSSSDSLLSLSFNQDGGCLAVGTTSGFRIYNVFPFQETFRRTFDNASQQHDTNTNTNSNDPSSSSKSSQTNGIGIVEMLFRCNLLALVGGGPSPRYPPNKVMIWDDHRGRCIGELSFRQRVLAVKLRRDRVAVALMDRVYVYNFSDLTLLDQIHTVSNPLGLLSLSPDAGGLHLGSGQSVGMVLACPSINRGGVRVELYGCRKTVLIDAHESSLAALSLSLSGTLLATASERGTLIRLFSTKDKNGTLLRELRRGVERAHIYCISFSMENQWLAATSDRGTVHIFYLGDSKNNNSTNHTSNNYRLSNHSSSNSIKSSSQSTLPSSSSSSSSQPFSSLLSSPKRFLQSKRILWEGEGSYAQIRGIDDPIVCAFVPDKPMTIAIVGKTDGSILLADFSKGSGEAERVAYHRFIKGTRSLTGGGNLGMGVVQKDESAVGGGGGGGRDVGKGAGITTETIDFGEEDVIFGDDDAADGFVTVEKASGE